MARKEKAPAAPKRCAPGVNESADTCLSHEELKLIASKYNVRSEAPSRIPTRGLNKAQLLRELRARLGHESGWTRLPFLAPAARSELAAAFRPAKPSSWRRNPRQWLNTNDIVNVMSQYERRYPSFHFLGAFPIDFDARRRDGRCIEEAVCRLDLADLRARGCSRLGAVFNLDRHDQRGSHWVAMYCGFGPSQQRRRGGNYGCFYYDSVAAPPPREVVALMARLRAQALAMDGADARRFAVDWNRERRQFKNTECGVFAITFLTRCLPPGAPKFEALCRAMGGDEQLHACRDFFFSQQ